MKERVIIGLLLVSILLFGIDRTTSLFSPVRGVVQIITIPIQYGLYSAEQTVVDTFSFLTFWKSGEMRIKNLEQRNLELMSYKTEAEALERENAQLRQQLGVTSKQAVKTLPAQVLGVGQRMEIGVGSNDGVKVGMTVVYLGNLVGRIVAVTPRESFVMLVTDADSNIPAKDGAVRGIVVGQFGTGVVLTQIAQTDQVNMDDVVLTSGEGQTYMQNLIIGSVTKVQGASTDLFRQAILEPQIDYQRLTTVFVVLE